MMIFLLFTDIFYAIFMNNNEFIRKVSDFDN